MPRAAGTAGRCPTCPRWPRSAPRPARANAAPAATSSTARPAAFRGRGWQTVGGTSLATPLWAALTALADQQRGSHRLGLLSPSLYRIDRTDPKAFTDVRTGNNDYLSRQGRYSHRTCRYGGQRGKPCYHATRGYDMASGLGTPQASYLVAALLRQHSNAGLG